jgi:hypothetical protein
MRMLRDPSRVICQRGDAPRDGAVRHPPLAHSEDNFAAGVLVLEIAVRLRGVG